MESTIPLHQVRTIVRSTSSTSLTSAVSRNHPSLPDDRGKIRLNLESWKNIHDETLDESSARAHIDKIFNFFINVASSNNLATTPAVQTLRGSLSILRRRGDFSREAAKKNWQERISQLSAPKTGHDPVSTLRNLCLQGFPIFNIWDGISFIYTICVEDIKTQLGAELHLYQFRMIISILRKCDEYFATFAGPTTVAASWKEDAQNQPLAVAFATTAVGGRKGDTTKEVIAAARQDFMTTLTKALTHESKKVNNRSPRNRPGNCPEYMIWPVVCQEGGKYKSLCFNMKGEWAYRCCGHCERTLEKLCANNIQIEDLWKTAFLSTEDGSDEEPYPYRELQKDIVDRYKAFGEL